MQRNVFEHYNEIKMTVFSDVMPGSLVQYSTGTNNARCEHKWTRP